MWLHIDSCCIVVAVAQVPPVNTSPVLTHCLVYLMVLYPILISSVNLKPIALLNVSYSGDGDIFWSNNGTSLSSTSQQSVCPVIVVQADSIDWSIFVNWLKPHLSSALVPL